MRQEFVKIANVYLPVRCLHFKGVNIKRKRGDSIYLLVPCGKCYECRKRIAAEWAFRLEIQSQEYIPYNMLFTYDEDHVPHYQIENGPLVQSLNRVHLQDSFKRLRYYLEDKFHVNVKIFAVGEYGAKTKRPHYHAILFSPVPLSDNGLQYLRVVLKDNIWPYGYSNIRNFRGSGKSVGKMCGYMCTYMLTTMPDVYENSYLRPFRYMSKNLGINIPREQEIIANCRKRGDWTYKIQTKDGVEKSISYPRYYLRRWLTSDEREERTIQFIEHCKNYEQFIYEEDEKIRNKYKENSCAYRRHSFQNRIATLRRHEKEYELANYRARKVHEHN